MVTFTGQCLVHRATIKQVHGDWPEALIEAQQACERLAVAADRNATGAAMYRLGELHRCRGDDEAATEAYRQAGEWGYDPQPGLALLWLTAGRIDAGGGGDHAGPSTRRPERARRGKLLPAFVEVMLAAGDRDAARRGVDELAEIAGIYGTPAPGGRGEPGARRRVVGRRGRAGGAGATS